MEPRERSQDEEAREIEDVPIEDVPEDAAPEDELFDPDEEEPIGRPVQLRP